MDLAEGRTTLAIAHRLTTVLAADRVLVFEQGRIVQDGAHSELVQHEDGAYRSLFADWLTAQTERRGQELLPL
jgi:ABC-type multidrug transport system fused ATPase/permease subunit